MATVNRLRAHPCLDFSHQFGVFLGLGSSAGADFHQCMCENLSACIPALKNYTSKDGKHTGK